ncbi:hypothetical protein YPPY34_2743 [Yersinia pestis PY-34]|nr:hypothetical protein YPPY05_2712 [Yersinia pestis PY-05]EIR05868.1 hypothetical protein YPPY06_2770 [Yersinia pestis PY-06]EIR16880.1 hypothetical protein YPPY07_2637 [Yersinia pestis PY-07]EIR75911.1 hypothetical protein YPPY34_2743 [Yersinia pestis PY-34]EIS17289.1 hypothetical protein YPPY52_2789 [Yersinia pestis PY-52]EIT15098.1 hypothetical protein YPPY92_2757 [Yersinia pestis PY-92]EIT15791.1 hypothetical protein YPPY94_2746 [Yersinia pestis PY-94]EIT45497.1 hypothetical protein YPP
MAEYQQGGFHYSLSWEHSLSWKYSLGYRYNAPGCRYTESHDTNGHYFSYEIAP